MYTRIYRGRSAVARIAFKRVERIVGKIETGSQDKAAEKYEEKGFSVFHINIIRIKPLLCKGNYSQADIGLKA